ncbi:MAG: hypothetical protein HQ484_03630 [Candidatus Aquiluna sp.]|nr:hypothetical protein [Aquiluna sp.]
MSIHSWLASVDQEKQVSASDEHISNGKFAALSFENSAFRSLFELSSFTSSFDVPWLTVAQEVRSRAPATSKEIEVNTGRLVGNDVHS